jgi:arylformamidase
VSRRILDISRPVAPGVPVWPGDTPYAFRLNWTIGPGCPVNVGHITMSPHTGAHADAPFHFDPDGADAASVDLSKYVGPCVVAVARPGKDGLSPPDLPPGTEALLRDAPRLLVRTYDARPAAFDEHLRHLTPARADWLAERGVVLVGLDSDSMDSFSSKELPCHHRLTRHGIAILEGLDLSAVAPGVYDLIALPLRLVGADASPVRAVLLERDAR